MLYLTQLIYINEGEEDTFHRFEDIVLPLLPKYNGKLLLRLRPGDNAFIEHQVDKPYEVHLVTFESEAYFERYINDEQRIAALQLKDKAVRESWIVKGERL